MEGVAKAGRVVELALPSPSFGRALSVVDGDGAAGFFLSSSGVFMGVGVPSSSPEVFPMSLAGNMVANGQKIEHDGSTTDESFEVTN